MNGQRHGPIGVTRFVEILKEYGFNPDQIEYMWDSRPYDVDEEILRKVAAVLSPLIANKNVPGNIIRTREEERRLQKSRHEKRLKNLK